MADKVFITKDGASLYYLANEGAGGFLNPPGHAEHNYSIQEFRGGHEVGSMSLSYATECDYIPDAVKRVARRKLSEKPGKITEDWVKQVYKYFAHCYSKNGLDLNVSNCVTYGKFWGNADAEKNENPFHHLGFLFVYQFDNKHTPRLDLIG